MQEGKQGLILLLMAAWLAVTGLFLYWMEKDAREEEALLAQTTAKAFFQQIVIGRLWNASHGGVYVPISQKTQPNQYLSPGERVLITTSGLRLVKLPPSSITREIAELSAGRKHAIQFHLTSLNPIRPENSPTQWEEQWLRSFEQGAEFQGEFVEDGETNWYRYMAPLLIEPECLNCHTEQGYREGDIRGGLSVSLPYPPHTHYHIIFAYGSVAIIGFLIILFGSTYNQRKQRFFAATFNSPVPTSVTDKNYTILMANEAYWKTFGPLPQGQKSIKCYEHRPGRSCHTDNCPLNRIMKGASQYSLESKKEKDGQVSHFIITAKPLHDARGKAIGSVESFQEITERKRNEEALEQANRQLQALSRTDGLTGVANRRHFDETLIREHARHARAGTELSLILLDLDHFKAYNDCYGHVRGDECLQQVSRMIQDCVTRPSDLVARYGGEEFACILPETDYLGASGVAEKIRRRILAQAIPHRESRVSDYVTASLGVLTVCCHLGHSPLEIVTEVDRLLYQAKAAGRNRVESGPSVIQKQEGVGNIIQLIWKDSFCSGHPLVDSQHRTLFQISNELFEAILSSRPDQEISAIIDKLLAETRQHFADEEAILAEVDYPGRIEHAEEHARLQAQGIELAGQFEEGSLKVGDVFQFLAHEVVRIHMLQEDQKYFAFINKPDQ